MKCLVVDDSAITRRILVHVLSAIGFDEILEAGDGQEALELCTPDVDIVLTDWNMPGMPGAELVRRLRAAPGLAALPVLLVVARAAQDDVVEAEQAGVDGHVFKPFTAEGLKRKIGEAMGPAAATGTDG